MTGSQVLVIGGAGFLGQAIIDQLLERGDIVSTFDLRSANRPNVNSIIGNINNPGDVRDALQDIDTVIHCASPIHGKPSAIYFKVNVDGTQVVLDMCKEMLVKKLVFTSSASVTYNGNDLFNADETVPYCDVHMDAYNETKAIAEEMVLNANSETLYTCSIRPSGIFGPKDSQGSLAIVEAAKKGQYKVVIGSNSSLFDLTYVDNVAYAHILAMEKLDDPSVQGEAFLITNDEPILFWDYPKVV